MRTAWPIVLVAGVVMGPQQGVKTVAVSSVSVPRDLRSLAGPRAQFDSLISSSLRREGFAVVPAQVSESIWLRLRDSIGGYFDSYTGKLIEAKLQMVHEGTLRELRDRHGVDAWLHSEIEFVGAPFTGGKVKWHGTEQESGATGGLGGFLFGTKKGSVPALSLFVSLEDTLGKEVYAGVGGIQLTTRVQGDRFVDVPPLSLLADSARNAAAVHLALDSLPAHLAAHVGR
ncbi:MAG TPA: hypothetical protein VFI66_07365 [Gemmatimonadales bacterium]|nr:hypothetical protein [Gemmatimonadales bacterium]